MIRTLIIDDEPVVRKGILSLLSKIEEELIIVGEGGNIAEALILAKSCQPDLVLLDINLPDGTGFDFLNQLSERNFNVVFITAYEEYALKAIKQGALDYLLKPVDSEELEEVIKKAVAIYENQLTERLKVAKSQLEGKGEKIVLRLFDSYQIIRFDELVYCQSDGGYTTFHLIDKRQFTISKSIKEYEKLLPEDKFFRTHQSYIVNITFIDRFEKGGGLFLKDEIFIPVAVRKREALLKSLF